MPRFPVHAVMASLSLLLALPALAGTITVTSQLRPNWFLEGSSTPLQGSPVTLEIDFDHTQMGSSVAGNGWLTIGGVRQAGVSANISFTTIAGSGSANGNVLGLSVVLDNQPYVDRSFYANGRYIRVFVDENPDQLPISGYDVNRFDINLYGGAPAGTGSYLSIGDALESFVATPHQAGQRIVFYPSPVQSFIWGPEDVAQVSLLTTQAPTAAPQPGSLPLLLSALGFLAGVTRRRRVVAPA